MNRRLHSMPFRKIQTFIPCKSMEFGYRVKEVGVRRTSRAYPTCSELGKPNGHVLRCRRCGFQADRHLVIAWKITTKLPTWVLLCCFSSEATDEFFSEVEQMVVEC